ncbi:paired amphipathic helix protein Sin3b-like isoform X2 [Amphibalanus amphitrite]|uniref:paired amphipathic helix protein Sin3b-like isoform X2 n=1 Tax=Amphibalanus amphitrite TaxID=1232801 RepID=UPI001C8FB265|nr:paired amphipathic helix protein Sin3b-like isoform X2 [Amphibalanus amphitrite]
MKRQEPPVSSDGSPAVVCVVPPARRSPAEPPVFSSPSLAAQPSPARLTAQTAAPSAAPLPHLASAGGGNGGQGQQPSALPPAPASHVVHGIMSYQQAPLAAGHGAHPAHAAYGENLSVKSDGGGGGGASQYSAGPGGGPASAAAAGPVPHSSSPQISHVGTSVTVSVSSSLHTLSNASGASVHLPQAHPMPVRRTTAPIAQQPSMAAAAMVMGAASAGKPPQPGGPLSAAPPAGTAQPAPTAADAGAGQPSYHRLKVEDALSYLDQVKSKFQNNPEVYNDFLDIMKEFKAQNIDTPGVITRVSSLFRGHPALIVGFNTFLPPGYKIEVQSSNNYLHVSMTAPGQVTTVVHTPTGGFQTYSDTVAPPPPPQPQQQQPPPQALPTAPGAPPKPSHQPPTQPPRSSYGTNNILSHAGAAAAGAGGHHVTSHHSYNQPPPSAAPTAAAPAAPVGGVGSNLPNQGVGGTQQSQPVEFNHAINYVNKIKNRFQGQPDVYKQFLEILHTYQKDQRSLKDGLPPSGPSLTETEVYAKVATLFQSHEDLMDEFGQFLPDATNGNAINAVNEHAAALKKPMKPSFQPTAKQLKRPMPTAPPAPIPTKKPRVGMLKDVTLAEAGKVATLNEYAFFDQVRKTLKNQDSYNNFLRVLSLYNSEIISRLDVIQLLSPFLGKQPGMLKWLKDFMGVKEGRETVEPIPPGMAKQERVSGDQAIEIDYSTCKRLGASYCALPKSYPQPRCSGRTQLCREVLNDTWVSFPSYSEDSTFVTSRKTQYEEYIYRCEDERFELDMVLETNLSTIRILEGVQKKLSRMAPEDAARYRLDDCLGGTSPTIHQRAVRRIYGDKAADIMDGLKRNPIVAVPVVLRRLKAKQDEWREAQKGFNKIWREQNEKYYLKSLDPQGVNFKQNDVKMLRSKALLNELYTLYDERHEQLEESGGDPAASGGPHTEFVYSNKHLLNDAANLIIHHVKRQTGIQKEDKAKIKLLLRQTLPGMFYHPKQELSDDERDDDDEDADDESDEDEARPAERRTRSQKVRRPEVRRSGTERKLNGAPTSSDAASSSDDDQTGECYTLFMASSNWYLFLRLHHILCERLNKIYERAVIMAAEEEQHKKLRTESTAIALRLKPKNEIDVEDYYPAFLDMVKNVLDNNMDSSQFEDTLREMFGIHAYNAFTTDKIVSGAVRQLQHIVTENVAQLTLKEYLLESGSGGAGGPCASADQRELRETAYCKRVEQMLTEENEHCMKIYLFKNAARMTVELLDTTDSEDSEDGFAEEKRRSTYQEKYASPSHHTDDEMKTPSINNLPLFLPRIVRRMRRLVFPAGVGGVKRERDATTPTSSGDRDVEDESSMDVDASPETDRKLKVKPEPLEMDGDEHFKLACNYRMMRVANDETYLHKRGAMTKARQTHCAVSRHLSARFRAWHSRWQEGHVSQRQEQLSEDWFLGRVDGLKPSRTSVQRNTDTARPPYVLYSRYRVEWLDPAPPPPAAAAAAAPTGGDK